MIASQVLDWLNENEYRGYPLRENTPRSIGTTGVILDAVILDASFVYIVNPLPTEVKLTQLVVGTNIVVSVTDQPTFSFPKASTYPVYCRNSEGSLLVVGAAVTDVPNGTYTFANTIFEDSVATEFRGNWKGINAISFPSHPNINGDQVWEEGYQFGINLQGSTIKLTAGSNQGIPISCENFFVGSITNDCATIISTINGAETISNPDVMRFNAGPYVAIFEDIPNYRLYIGLNFTKEDVCKNPLINPI